MLLFKLLQVSAALTLLEMFHVEGNFSDWAVTVCSSFGLSFRRCLVHFDLGGGTCGASALKQGPHWPTRPWIISWKHSCARREPTRSRCGCLLVLWQWGFWYYYIKPTESRVCEWLQSCPRPSSAPVTSPTLKTYFWVAKAGCYMGGVAPSPDWSGLCPNLNVFVYLTLSVWGGAGGSVLHLTTLRIAS